MKLSVAWIFDHIDADWRTCDINELVAKFNQMTAEIESFHSVSFSMDNFFLCQQKVLGSDTIMIPELGKEVSISKRTNPTDLLSSNATNSSFLVKKINDRFEWATLSDFSVEKDGLVPALTADDKDLAGGWRAKFECDDVILDVDNKSITHRPDMWGHRGFAREIAAFLNLPLLPADRFLKKLPVQQAQITTQADAANPIALENKIPKLCSKFNGLYIDDVDNRPSDIFMVSRLMKVDARPINALVDLTNYVMLDWSQPVHAYDAGKIADKKVVIRMAKLGEKLLLLDGNELVLTEQDMVIADGKKPMCLAGVKGGINESVDAQTTTLFFEAANFDATTVRQAAMRHKTRTDSSARFEKTLDSNQALQAVYRFLALAEQIKLKLKPAANVLAVGVDAPLLHLELAHSFIEKRLGIAISSDDVVDLLTRIEFGVVAQKTDDDVTYRIDVPSFRSSKDIKIKEDIVEEVARLYGFNKISLTLPRIFRRPFSLAPILRRRAIKNYLAQAAAMMEQQNYAFFDEQFLTSLGLQEQQTITLRNPVSENYSRLITTLVPGLLKNMQANFVHRDTINFFEVGRIWGKKDNNTFEKISIAGLFFHRRLAVDFYECKHHIEQMLVTLGFNLSDLQWKQMDAPALAWYKPYQSAELMYQGQSIGRAGKINPVFMHKLDVLPESDAFVFEIDGDFLLYAPVEVKQYAAVSRFQETFIDMSLMVPLTLETQQIQTSLRNASTLVTSVQLIDFFEKEEWGDVRSLTFRLWLSDQEKTIEKVVVDQVWQAAIAIIEKLGAKIRS